MTDEMSDVRIGSESMMAPVDATDGGDDEGNGVRAWYRARVSESQRESGHVSIIIE